MDLKAYYYYTISTYYEAEDSSRILLVSRVVCTSSFMVAQRLVSIPGNDKFFLSPGRTIHVRASRIQNSFEPAAQNGLLRGGRGGRGGRGRGRIILPSLQHHSA